MLIDTPRLVLREFRDDDFSAIHEYASDPEVVAHEPWGPNTKEDTALFVTMRQALAQLKPRGDYELAVTVKESRRLIGACGFRISKPEVRSADLGFTLHREFWGQGYATEAARAMIRFGFRELDLHRIWAVCGPENRASQRVLEKCGLQPEGRLRRDMLCRGVWRDSLLYAILEEEWEAGLKAGKT